IWPDLGPFFTETEDGITQSRLLREYEKAVSKSEKRSVAGRRGGISKALKSKDRGLANATVLPKHSSDIRYKNNPQTPLEGAPHDQPDLIAEQVPPPQPKAPDYPEEFQRLWEVYPRRSGSN